MLLLNEDRTISMNGSAFPRSGWAFIILGGPGSGKNYVLNNLLPIDGKVFDIDKVVENGVNLYKKKMYGDNTSVSQNKINNIRNFYRKEIAPYIISRMREQFFNNRKILDNVIFLNCGNKNDELVHGIISQVKDIGYKVCLVFIAANRSVALKRNIQRDRSVSDKGFHSRSNRANSFIDEFLTKNTYPEVDIAYLILSSGPNLNQEEGNKNNVIKLEKTADGFRLPQNSNPLKPNNEYIKTNDDLKNFLGPKETFKTDDGTQKREPQVYLNSREIKRNNMEPNKEGDYVRENLLKNKIKKMVIEALIRL